MSKRKFLTGALLIVSSLFSQGWASNIKANVEYANASDYYRKMVSSMQEEHWREASFYGEELTIRFEQSPLVYEAYYSLGVASFNLNELEKADRYFSRYLKSDPNPKHFTKTLQYKFEVARAYDEGYKKHLFGIQKMPKLMKAYDEALALYDEVITTLPRDPLAAQALYYKGELLLKVEDYTKSVETLQTLIRRFPKHPLTPDAYVAINQVYATYYDKEFADPDHLDLAEINLRKFKFNFPGESRLEACEQLIGKMREGLAADLYEIGDFYKRTKKTKAAIIYFNTILKKYPETSYAKKAKRFLERKEIKALAKEVKAEQEEKSREVQPEGLLVENYEVPA